MYYGMVKRKLTPSEDKPLVKDDNGEPGSGMLRYSIVLGILSYSSRCCPFY